MTDRFPTLAEVRAHEAAHPMGRHAGAPWLRVANDRLSIFYLATRGDVIVARFDGEPETIDLVAFPSIRWGVWRPLTQDGHPCEVRA